MIDPKFILPFLQIDEKYIKKLDIDTDENGNISIIYLELKDERTECPKCKSKHIYLKEKYVRKIKHSVLSHQELVLLVTVHRYECKDCHKTFTQQIPFVNGHSTISKTTIANIMLDLGKNITFKFIAEQNNVSATVVSKILDQNVKDQYRGKLTQAICVDEFCFKHSGSSIKGKYPCVISDAIEGKIIDIIESRRIDYLNNYFDKIPEHERSIVKFFVSDMYDGYETIRAKYFKNSTHVVDMFHVIKGFNEVISKIRIRILKTQDYKSKEYIFLKKNWKIFLINRQKANNLTYKGKYGITYPLVEKIDFCLKKFPELHNAYWDSYEFSSKAKSIVHFSDAEKHIQFFINKYSTSTIPEQLALGKTLEKWKYCIANAIIRNQFEFRLSNGKAEANNNVIQTYINHCYGCTNFKRLRKRILYMQYCKH